MIVLIGLYIYTRVLSTFFGCPWDASCAASACNLEVLKYLHENGCPWNWEAYEYAAAYGNVDMIEYLHDNGCPWMGYDACCCQRRPPEYAEILARQRVSDGYRRV